MTDLFTGWLPRMTYPIRYGMHANTAFALSRSLAWARRLAAGGDAGLADAITDAAARWYRADADYPGAWEPSGSDFLSPALAEAELMAQLLPPGEFSAWLGAFCLASNAASRPPCSGPRSRRTPATARSPTCTA